MTTVAMLLMAIPSTIAARAPMVSRNPTVKGLSRRAQNGRCGRIGSSGAAPSTVGAASVPAAGSTASGSGEGVPSVMDTL